VPGRPPKRAGKTLPIGARETLTDPEKHATKRRNANRRYMTRAWPAVGVLVLFGVTLGTGCAGGGGAELSRTHLIQRGDAACRRQYVAFGRMKVGPEPDLVYPTARDLKAAQVDSAQLLSLIRPLARDLASLHPPRADARDYRTLVTGVQAELGDTEREQQAATRNDARDALKQEIEREHQSGIWGALATRMGFQVCGAQTI